MKPFLNNYIQNVSNSNKKRDSNKFNANTDDNFLNTFSTKFTNPPTLQNVKIIFIKYSIE